MRPPSGKRNTKQRRAILEELRNVTCHPSADEIYNMVRRRLPRISIGTVYRNLELLAREGDIQKLEMPGTLRRFDGNARNHYHARCLRCGRVSDLHVTKMVELKDVINDVADFDVFGHRIEFIGLCATCRKRRIPTRRRTQVSLGGTRKGRGGRKGEER